jgi:hypothetical protein
MGNSSQKYHKKYTDFCLKKIEVLKKKGCATWGMSGM